MSTKDYIAGGHWFWGAGPDGAGDRPCDTEPPDSLRAGEWRQIDPIKGGLYPREPADCCGKCDEHAPLRERVEAQRAHQADLYERGERERRERAIGRITPEAAAAELLKRRTATGLLYHAAALVSGDRDREHGAKEENFQNIADLWNAYLGARIAGEELSAHDVGLLMSLLKIGRTKTGTMNLDDYIDGAGYMACAAEVRAAA